MKTLQIASLAVALAVIGIVSFGTTSHVGSALIGVAHAGSAVDAAPSPAPDTGLPWIAYVALAAAFLGGLLRVLDILLPGLRWLAPRTKTKLDDGLLETLESAHDRIATLEELVSKLAGTPQHTHPPAAPKGALPGFSRLGLLVIVALTGGSLLACAALKAEVKAIKDGVVTCAKADKDKIKATALVLGTKALGQLLESGTLSWKALRGEAELAGKTHGLEVAACAFDGFVSDLATLFEAANPTAPLGLLAPASPLDGSAEALSSFQAAHGIKSIVQ